MFRVLHHDTSKTDIQARPRPPEDSGETLPGGVQSPSLSPSNHNNSRHVREASNRWSSEDNSNEIVDTLYKALSSTSTLQSGSVDRAKSLQPLSAAARSGESSSEEEPDMNERRLDGSMQPQLGVWDVINQEILDSFGVYGTRGLLDCEQNARKQLAASSSSLSISSRGPGGLRPELDKQEALISLVAVQLLAACFTLPPEPIPGSLPSAFYYTRWKESSSSALPPPSCHLPDPRLISCLGLHARYRHAPASGHHARNPSVVSSWPDLYSGPSREELLADEVCKRRRLRLQAEKRGSGAIAAADETDYSFSPYLDDNDPVEGGAASPKKCRCQRSSLQKRTGGHGVMGWCGRYARSASSQRATETLRSSGSSTSTCRANDHRSRYRYVSHWSLRPVLRSEAHPVFIQPVKELVMKRWRAIRSTFVPSSADRGRPRVESAEDMCTCDSRSAAGTGRVDERAAPAGDGSGGDYEQQPNTFINKEESSNDAPQLFELKRAIPLSHLPKTMIVTHSSASPEAVAAAESFLVESRELARAPTTSEDQSTTAH
ncbi:hypothetical protein FGG08_003475 [Glutinoglossum americanum]|uniref:Uncharacterized protein n=1 Tax=Glutinoglossum americanum TaxID=1670608 RepID=A0A9P8KY25_9PEZI|nr:hypothetical protein FGG08_003475 [Glutinoglossum americanum]